MENVNLLKFDHNVIQIMIVVETKFVTMVTVLTPAESQAVGPMQSVKLDSIPQNVFACLGILEMLRLHVIYVSIDMIALECNGCHQ